MTETPTIATASPASSASQDWLRALQLTAVIPRNRERLLSTVIEEHAQQFPAAPALLSDRECFTFRELTERSNRYARWAQEQGLSKGNVVGLLMTNRPEYFAIWLGLSSMGVIVALLNTNLTGPSLAHCLRAAAPGHVIVSAELVEPLQAALPHLQGTPAIWSHGPSVAGFDRIDTAITQYAARPLARHDRPSLTIEDRALYIYTSGTTGLPKAASVSHARILQWTHWFAGMMDFRRSDRMYSCLPMYHSIGGVLVPGAALVGGGSVAIREKFSASHFWNDVVRWDCTLFQYIGEFCRYLLHAAPSGGETRHRVRLACGNGLAADVWTKFSERFHIPRILEFYASTEGGVSLFNAEGERGAIGRIPGYLRHRYSPALVRIDPQTSEPLRNEQGFCIPAGPNEPGEAIGKMLGGSGSVGTRFEGYTDAEASQRKILRGVFTAGDAWVRTGDLMRRDERGYFYFVDRLGDTFRWKGENVATTEVAEVLCAFPGIHHASVYGVQVPASEGRAGMATIVAGPGLNLPGLSEHLAQRLPAYARPLFLRLAESMDVTGTFKYSKTDLAREGYNPGVTNDVIYFNDPQIGAFRRLDPLLFDQIQNGVISL